MLLKKSNKFLSIMIRNLIKQNEILNHEVK